MKSGGKASPYRQAGLNSGFTNLRAKSPNLNFEKARIKKLGFKVMKVIKSSYYQHLLQDITTNQQLSRRMPPKTTSLIVQITESGITNAVVKTVECLFWRYYGRVEGANGKRKKTNHTKFFQMPFLIDNYKKNLEGQHADHWGEYSASKSPELKKAFFQKEVIFGNTMLAHLDWGRSNSFWGRSISTTCWLYSRLVRITPNCITGEGRTWINWWGMSTIRKIAHLIRQVNWIIRIGSKCPYLALTRWLSMGSFCDWVHDYRLQIIQQYLESSHESEPDDRWWLTTTAVKIITSPINHYDSLVHFHTLPQWSPIFQLLNMWPTTPEVDLKTTL